MELFAFLTAEDLIPLVVFVAIVAGVFWLLSAISNRNSQAEERLERIGRPKSLVEIEMAQAETKRPVRRAEGGVQQPRRRDGAAVASWRRTR